MDSSIIDMYKDFCAVTVAGLCGWYLTANIYSWFNRKEAKDFCCKYGTNNFDLESLNFTYKCKDNNVRVVSFENSIIIKIVTDNILSEEKDVKTVTEHITTKYSFDKIEAKKDSIKFDKLTIRREAMSNLVIFSEVELKPLEYSAFEKGIYKYELNYDFTF